jgi:hypothetical protein
MDGKTNSKLGVVSPKVQTTTATKFDDVEVPEYMWDMRALGL